MLHSKEFDNSKKDNVSYCNLGLSTTEFIDVNSGKLSETSVPWSNCNKYNVATYKEKAPYLSDAEQNHLIKKCFCSR